MKWVAFDLVEKGKGGVIAWETKRPRFVLVGKGASLAFQPNGTSYSFFLNEDETRSFRLPSNCARFVTRSDAIDSPHTFSIRYGAPHEATLACQIFWNTRLSWSEQSTMWWSVSLSIRKEVALPRMPSGASRSVCASVMSTSRSR